ncbi:MAG: M1 family aminopeptidase [Pseudomonadota bacterium]|nr:M1 family aminopeptidase [Pseudomonadota bacterium]
MLRWRLFDGLTLLTVLLLSSAVVAQSTLIEGLRPGVTQQLAEHRKIVLSRLSYDLSFDLPARPDQRIPASAVIEFELSEADEPLVLDFKESAEKLGSVEVNGQPSDYRFESEHLVIPAGELRAGQNRISVQFTAGDSSLNRNPEFLYTLFVPDRARTAFPLFDQPNLKARYTLTLTMPADWEAISNAPLQQLEALGERKRLRFASTELISSYLFSFVAGKFQRETRQVDGRQMTMLHRESDREKVARNLDAVFDLHGAALSWLEEYTAIDYPFQKFDFALIPSFQYGGMEHVGAIQYRADSLLLNAQPSQTQLLSRASLIAHETAHMWFGDLVTMDWFNDVWTKEVFANFMAAKIVNPSFPEINHDLNFLIRHFPSAYAVDRTQGANPIRQDLQNLNEAGTLYGNIIYNKAPIMMRQLETLIGQDEFRSGLREYLANFAYGNATWPDLIAILERKTEVDLQSWSEVWVNTAGRPHFLLEESAGTTALRQIDPEGTGRVWPQQFLVSERTEGKWRLELVESGRSEIAVFDPGASAGLLNADGRGYGLFPADPELLSDWESLDSIQRGSLLVSLFENLLEGNRLSTDEYLNRLIGIIELEDNQLLLNLMLRQVRILYWNFLSEAARADAAVNVEKSLWALMLAADSPSSKKIFFEAYRDLALTTPALDQLLRVWRAEIVFEGLVLSETDQIALATVLAIKLPEQADQIVTRQLAQINNQDRQRRFDWIRPALSPVPSTRRAFFETLADEDNRAIESWVLGALDALHHPVRRDDADAYILPSLELLEEIQVTGDIFFPARWLGATLGSHNTPAAAAIVRDFLAQRPEYNHQLRLKILQAADPLFRAERLLSLPNF